MLAPGGGLWRCGHTLAAEMMAACAQAADGIRQADRAARDCPLTRPQLLALAAAALGALTGSGIIGQGAALAAQDTGSGGTGRGAGIDQGSAP